MYKMVTLTKSENNILFVDLIMMALSVFFLVAVLLFPSIVLGIVVLTFILLSIFFHIAIASLVHKKSGHIN